MEGEFGKLKNYGWLLIFSFSKIFQNTMVSYINFRITAVAKIQTGKDFVTKMTSFLKQWY
jgi:hypothetical protein